MPAPASNATRHSTMATAKFKLGIFCTTSFFDFCISVQQHFRQKGMCVRIHFSKLRSGIRTVLTLYRHNPLRRSVGISNGILTPFHTTILFCIFRNQSQSAARFLPHRAGFEEHYILLDSASTSRVPAVHKKTHRPAHNRRRCPQLTNKSNAHESPQTLQKCSAFRQNCAGIRFVN